MKALRLLDFGFDTFESTALSTLSLIRLLLHTACAHVKLSFECVNGDAVFCVTLEAISCHDMPVSVWQGRPGGGRQVAA